MNVPVSPHPLALRVSVMKILVPRPGDDNARSITPFSNNRCIHVVLHTAMDWSLHAIVLRSDHCSWFVAVCNRWEWNMLWSIVVVIVMFLIRPHVSRSASVDLTWIRRACAETDCPRDLEPRGSEPLRTFDRTCLQSQGCCSQDDCCNPFHLSSLLLPLRCSQQSHPFRSQFRASDLPSHHKHGPGDGVACCRRGETFRTCRRRSTLRRWE